MSFKITLMPEGRVIEAQEGANLFAVLRENGAAPESPCGGKGSCGKCRVTVNGEEKHACRTEVDRDMEVIVPKAEKTRVLVSGSDVRTEMKPLKEGMLAAFDIGTTTVVCYLLDGKTGEELASASMLNPQQPYGADVISRIQEAMNGALDDQAALVRNGMEGLMAECCEKAGCEIKDISVISVVGNPCMQQLFFGIMPDNLAKVPFEPVLTRSKAMRAAPFLPACRDALVIIVPDISGYVGADTMGCVLSTGMYMSGKMTLMVDIGTNGEMVLGNKNGMTACSTAAGPALEGAKIKFGMRGAPGAIDHVKFEDGRYVCSVIGGGEAKGICGSGLIDAVAAALQKGDINERGRIQNKDELDGERFIMLTNGIYLTQTDIREVQLAKGAIAAGIALMAEELGIKISDIGSVLLAGAFGTYMDPKSACEIRLLPYELRDRVRAVGNAAGAGAKLLVCNRDQMTLVQELLEKIRFIELAKLPEFQMTFAMGMLFEDME